MDCRSLDGTAIIRWTLTIAVLVVGCLTRTVPVVAATPTPTVTPTTTPTPTATPTPTPTPSSPGELGVELMGISLLIAFVVIIGVVVTFNYSEELRKQITTLVKAGRKCAHCGRDISSYEKQYEGTLKYCPECGDHANQVSALPKSKRAVKELLGGRQCPYCNKTLSPGQDDCPRCNRRSDTVVAAVRDTRCLNCGANVEPAQQQRGGPLNHCPECGADPYSR